MKHWILSALGFATQTVALRTQSFCKPLSATPGWPARDAWIALNTSVAGQLFAPVPAGAVCHPSRPEYDSTRCAVVMAQWTNTTFHALNSVSADYNDDTCFPSSNTSCSNSGYPTYVIEARSASDVQHGVSFAHKTGVRLVIKGTGHDYPGRSSGPDSLSIYMHNIRGISMNSTDARAIALGGVASVKIYAGERIQDIYGFAADNNVTVIGGADPHVGIAGWISGGGHGPLTAKYGMGADQVIEMEVVTADGILRTVNSTSQADLFWALRGGGAGTFAVVISVTVKAHPAITASEIKYTYSTTANSDAFWALTAYWHSQVPALVDAGLYGYYYIVPNDPNEPDDSAKGKILGIWIAPSLTSEQATQIFESIDAHISSTNWSDRVAGNYTPSPSSPFFSYWLRTNAPQTAGFSGRLGSRLLTNTSLLGPSDKLIQALRTVTTSPTSPNASWTLTGHAVGPVPNTRVPTGGIAGGSNAVLPAWRESYVHLITPRSWAANDEATKLALTTDLRDVRVQALRMLEPESGAYMSESDPTEPEWQRTKFGLNYPRLLHVKQKWDPKGVFWCHQCVGSELWKAEGAYGIENGVGQNHVRLCRRGLDMSSDLFPGFH